MAVVIEKLSAKQALAAAWWASPTLGGHDGVICDGAVRSGKTVACSLGFVLWACARFSGASFAVCSKSRLSARRNIVTPLVPYLRELGFKVDERTSEDRLTIGLGDRSNTFYLFGGMNGASAALIQGLTLAGVLFDEAALMPESFVSQATARCSVKGSKLWFNCNPDSPHHWFKKGYIDRAAQKNLLYLHFTMDDNPSLDPDVLKRYSTMYAGRFYRRYVLGLWESPDGLVYDFMADGTRFREPPPEPHERYAISCDYGTSNPASFGLWGLKNGVWYRFAEYWYDGRGEGVHKTDAEYADALQTLAGSRRLSAVAVDPSAASFIEELRRRGLKVIPAANSVLNGIRLTAGLLKAGRLVVSPDCTEAVREFSLYRWQDEKPVKEHDHAMDEIRYFASTLAAPHGGDGAAVSVYR